MKTKFQKLMVLVVLLVVSLATGAANANLVAHWKLDETSGSTADDSSGNAHTGTLHGELVWASTKGKYGGAVCFGRTDGDHIEISMTKLSFSQGTISLWGNLAPDPQPPRHRYLFGHSTSPHWSNRIQLYLPTGGSHLSLGLGDSHARYARIKFLQPETWYHIALTWDHGKYVVYVDGIPEAWGTYTGFDNLNSVADIGNDGRTDGIQRNESFNGLIDDVVVFNHALNETEITQLCRGASDLFTSASFLTLLDNICQAERISKKCPPQEVVTFLEKKIAEYDQWEGKNPKDIGLHYKRLSCEQYFLLAKAKEAANAPSGEVVEAYKQSISQLQFRRNYVPALLWLYKNISARDFIDTVKKSVYNSNGTADNLHRIAKDFESSKNWATFELFLDAIFSEVDDSTSFAEAIAAGLNKDGLWADNFSRYVRNKPGLTQYSIDICEKRAQEKMTHNEFLKAAEIYRDIVNQCGPKQDKTMYELKAYECIFKSGEYDRALSELDHFINDSKSVNKDSVTKAMLLKGQVYIQLNEIDRACDTFSTLMKEYPETEQAPEASFFIGYCNMLQGKYRQATEALRLVIKNYPQSSYASKAHLCLARINRVME